MRQENLDYLSITNIKSIKGIFAICVLTHHLYQCSGILRVGVLSYLGACFQALGFFSVAVFFFLSGYGLMKSVNTWEKIILFPKQKILPFYTIIVVFTLLYTCFKICIGVKISLLEILQSLTLTGTIIDNGWYLQVQFLFYCFFYLALLIAKNINHINLVICFMLVFVLVCCVTNLSSLYYERAFIFCLGMIWAKYKERIDGWLNNPRTYLVSLIVSFFVFAIDYCLSYVFCTVLLRGLSYFFFIYVVMLLIKKVPVHTNVTEGLGSIALEIYIMQGMFLKLFHTNPFYITNQYLYIIVVSIFTILSAIIIHPITKLIYRLCRK